MKQCKNMEFIDRVRILLQFIHKLDRKPKETSLMTNNRWGNIKMDLKDGVVWTECVRIGTSYRFM
jgi:hypothetical protein